MNQEEKKAFRQKILATLKQVRSDIEKLVELTKPIPPENAIGRVSRMDAINNKSVNEANLRRARMKLTRLEAALQKLDMPKFGICTRCSKPIQAARLMYMPESTCCVRCAR